MGRKIFLVFCFLFATCYIYSQVLDTVRIDNVLTDVELNFHDSIVNLNQQNKIFSDSRMEYNYGLELFNRKDFNQAGISFTKAIKIDSTFSKAYYYRGRCYEYSSDSLAILDYKIAFSLDSSNFSPLYSLARIQADIDFNTALNTYKYIIQSSNSEYIAYYEIGILLYIKKDIEGAIEAFTKSLNIKKDARTFNDRASCYRLLNENELAIKDYITAIALDSELAFIYNNLASTYRNQGDSVKALSYYSLAINKDTNYVLAYNNRGGLYIDLNNLDNALNDIDKAISIDNDYAPAYNNKGVIFHIQKKYAEALFYFDKAILLDNNYAKAYLNRGITRQMKRDEYGACNDWIKAKKLGINLANKYLDNDCN